MDRWEDYPDYNGKQKKSEPSLWRRVGMLLAILSAINIGAGIADVIYSYFQVFQNNASDDNKNLQTWTYVSSGIWGAIPAFITGILAVALAKDLTNPQKRKRWVYIAIATALLFLPAMICIAALVAYYVHQETEFNAENLTGGSNSVELTVLFFIPLVYGLHGVLEFLLTGFLLIKYYTKKPEEEYQDEKYGYDQYGYGQSGPSYGPYSGGYGPGGRAAPAYPRFPRPRPPPPPPPPPPRPRWPMYRPY